MDDVPGRNDLTTPVHVQDEPALPVNPNRPAETFGATQAGDRHPLA
jgi:hypothetical protein